MCFSYVDWRGFTRLITAVNVYVKLARKAYGGLAESSKKCRLGRASPVLEIIDAVASLENVAPTALSEESSINLSEHIDPDALNTIVTEEKPVAITFKVNGYRIKIDGPELEVYAD